VIFVSVPLYLGVDSLRFTGLITGLCRCTDEMYNMYSVSQYGQYIIVREIILLTQKE